MCRLYRGTILPALEDDPFEVPDEDTSDEELLVRLRDGSIPAGGMYCT